jgi:hypothetical protein
MNLYETKQKYGKIADFISDIDNNKKLVLLPYSEFLKKYNSLKEIERYRFLNELKRCIMYDEISNKYIIDEWTKVDLQRFVVSQIESIEKNVELEDNLNFKIKIYKELQNSMNSNSSISEKIVTITKIKMNYLSCVGKVMIEDDDLLFDIENKLEFLKTAETRPIPNAGNINIPQKYIDFWMQFNTKENPKTLKPYFTKNDVEIFLKQAFGGEPKKTTFNPDITRKELYHAAWLFYRENKRDLKKTAIARIMKNNFPNHFPDDLNKETKKIRDGLEHNKRVFHKI